MNSNVIEFSTLPFQPRREGVWSLVVTDSSDVIGVLLALYLLTDADIHDSVPQHQLRIDANRPQADVDRALVTLVQRGLAATVFISEDTSWVGITDEGVRFIAQLAGRAKQSVN